ncbi:MAG: hypothetical protein IJT00_01190, partial [Lachnospiraceae bacterium]|nr:hypothetical protein [Lachnospiraceae bacterium]
MFNLVVFTWAYLFFGSGREEGYQSAMGWLLLFLVIRYLLFSFSLFLALREFDGKGSVLTFLPFFRYYEFGALSGSTLAGMAALT